MARGLGNAGATIIVNGNSSQEKIDKAVAEYKTEGLKQLDTYLMLLMKKK